MSNEIANRILSKYDRSYRAIKFNLKIDAYISRKANVEVVFHLDKSKNSVPNSNETIGYIVYIPNLIKKDTKKIDTPGILSVFSLNGTMTLVWSYLVWTRFSNLINEIISSKKPRIILAQFSPEISNNIIPTDLSFLNSTKCEIKIDVSICFASDGSGYFLNLNKL